MAEPQDSSSRKNELFALDGTNVFFQMWFINIPKCWASTLTETPGPMEQFGKMEMIRPGYSRTFPVVEVCQLPSKQKEP